MPVQVLADLGVRIGLPELGQGECPHVIETGGHMVMIHHDKDCDRLCLLADVGPFLADKPWVYARLVRLCFLSFTRGGHTVVADTGVERCYYSVSLPLTGLDADRLLAEIALLTDRATSVADYLRVEAEQSAPEDATPDPALLSTFIRV